MRREYFLLVLCSLLLQPSTAEQFVHILSKYNNQQMTSTTLNWLPRTSYDPSREIVIGGFETVPETEEEVHGNHADKPELKNRALFVCRALHNSVWVAGAQKYGEGKCTVSIHGNVRSYDKYELLENVNNAARVSWAKWDKYHSAPVGVVATDKMYVARHVADKDEKESAGHEHRYTHYIGTLDPDDKLGMIIYVKDNGEEGSAESGEVLVETEPVRYELHAVKLNWPKKRVIKRTSRVLGKSTITNTGETSATLANAFAYAYNYTIYWGQGHAILRGLPTSIKLANNTSLPDIRWGIEEQKDRADVYTVKVLLEPGTGVNVTLRANYTNMEVPYTGTLISHYEDGATKERQIAGNRREETMTDVEPEFGPVYFLTNDSLVPTTVPSTTTEYLTIRPLQEDASNPDDSGKQQQHQQHDENLILPAKSKPDVSSMQSDDGGPLSLKNKVDATQSTANSRKASAGLLALLVAVYRIT